MKKAKKDPKQPRPAATPPAPPKKDADPDLEKGQGKDDDDEDDDDEDGEDDEDDVSKSIPLDDLEKGLRELEAAAAPAPSRKDELLEKAKRERLSKSERDELDDLMDGVRATQRIERDDDLVKGLDVSPALDSLATHLAEAIDGLDASLQKSQTRGDAQFAAMSKALLALGEVVKGLAKSNDELRKSLNDVLDGPAREPRAVGRPRATATERPANGGTGSDRSDKDPPNPREARRELMRVMERMHSDSLSKSLGGQTPSGISIRSEMARVSAGQPPSEAMQAEINAYLKGQTARA